MSLLLTPLAFFFINEVRLSQERLRAFCFLRTKDFLSVKSSPDRASSWADTMPNALKAPVNLGNSGIFIDNRLKRDEEDEGDKNMNCISIINVRSLKLSSFDIYEIILP